MNASRKTKAGKGRRPKPAKGSGRGPSKASEQPLAQSRSFKTASPRVREASANGQRSCTIRHSELFASIPSTTTFDVTIYPLNPGQSVVFPWLSVQAQGWERYRFKKLDFEFLSRTAATTNGSVTMAVDYDASDPTPLSELQMMSYQNSTQDAPWKNQKLVCAAASLNGADKYRYVRTTNTPPSNAELRQEDSGKLFVSAIGGTAGTNFGTLIAHYEVEFVTPQAPSGGVPSNSKILNGSSGVTPQAIMGTDAVALGTIATTMQSIGTTGASDQGTRFTMDGLIPGMLYQAALSVGGTGFSSFTPWTWGPGIISTIQGAAYNTSTANSFVYDFISDARTAYIDFVPANGAATVSPGSALFSVLNQVNPDVIE